MSKIMDASHIFFLIIILFFISMNLVLSEDEKEVFANISVMKPQWSKNGSNSSTYTGNAILLYTKWDDNVNLSHAILSTNETGAWKNYTDNTYGSVMTLANLTYWSNFTWQNTTIAGIHAIAWKIFANDTENYWNVTDEMNFTVNIAYYVGVNLSSALQRGILFGDITASTNDNMAENDSTGTGNVTEYWIGNDPSSSGEISLFHNASDMTRGAASDTILIANVTHESNTTAPDPGSNVNMTNYGDGSGGDVVMTTLYQGIGGGNCTDVGKNSVCWIAYWLDIPSNIASGTYNTTYNYCGNLTISSTACG